MFCLFVFMAKGNLIKVYFSPHKDGGCLHPPLYVYTFFCLCNTPSFCIIRTMPTSRKIVNAEIRHLGRRGVPLPHFLFTAQFAHDVFILTPNYLGCFIISKNKTCALEGIGSLKMYMIKLVSKIKFKKLPHFVSVVLDRNSFT